MAIPIQHQHRMIYHFSHVDNLENLVQHGLLANTHHLFPQNIRSIAAHSIQDRRAKMQITCGPKGSVHNYVPLYFGSISPMLLGVINSKNMDQFDILYFEFPIELVDRNDVVFSNSAANAAVAPTFYSDPSDLIHLNWQAIDSRKWGNVDEGFRRNRMAEVLVHKQLPITQAARCVVWNQSVKEAIENRIDTNNFPPIEFEDSYNRPHWFTNFMNNKNTSVVQGPKEINLIYQSSLQYVLNNSGQSKTPPLFSDINQLLQGLKANFGCIPQTAELVGLRSANGVHKRTVDIHTLEVVDKLHDLTEFKALNQNQKTLTEVAAYLHDIGKGPRARWADGLQRVDPNHPVGAMPMLAEILTKHVAHITHEDAATLMKLVCYHDLIGDVLGKGRNENQINDICQVKQELDMLFALGKADVLSLVETWWEEESAKELYTRCTHAIGNH